MYKKYTYKLGLCTPHVRKLLLIMRLTTFMLFMGMLQISLAAIGQKINLAERNSSIAKVFKKISQQSGYGFIVEGSLLKKAKAVTINSKDADLTAVLAEIFEGQPLGYSINDKAISVSAKPMAIHSPKLHENMGANALTRRQQQGAISGRVLNDLGEALPGASIKILQTNHSLQSSADGSYSMRVDPGTYVVEVSYVSFQTKRITDVVVKPGQQTTLNLILRKASNEIDKVVVTGSFKKESTAALYAKQKSEGTISNGISREQMSALPDKNIGEALKRISGVSTTDNRKVVIRGIAERYNIAMMDGATLPSTDVQIRDFDFDIVPSNLIDNVIVNKTASPDMSFGFGGGLVQINTLAIPESNFTTFTIGSKYTSGSTGKDFLGYGRGKLDYFGFDDGTRDHFPKDIVIFDGANYNVLDPYAPVAEGVKAFTPSMIAEQNKKIGGLERMGTRLYKTAPGQNYQFSLGRQYNLHRGKFGFVGSITYRNEQNIDEGSEFERGRWQKIDNDTYFVETGELLKPTTSNQYNFNSSWATLLNLGWNSKFHKVNSRNFYSRMFSNQFARTKGWANDLGTEKEPFIREYDRPKFINMLQNRLEGEHHLGAFRFDWNLARNTVDNLEQDATEAWLRPGGTLNESYYSEAPTPYQDLTSGNFNRAKYHYKETNHIAEAALSYQTNLLGQKQIFKTGYQFLERHGVYDWMILPVVQIGRTDYVLPVQEWAEFFRFEDPKNAMLYMPAPYTVSAYEGKNKNQAYYGMLDSRFTSWLRVLWGARAEYYKYERIQNGVNDKGIQAYTTNLQNTRYVDPKTGRIVSMTANPEIEEKIWRYLPSVSITASPTNTINIRAAYAQSVVRPALIENSIMVRQDPALGGTYRRSEGVLSTVIDHYDVRFEWYPQVGEVFSFGYFYKYFDKPVELYRQIMDSSNRTYVTTNNSEWAKVQGWELDFRKSFGFIKPDWKFLDDLYLSGNVTLQNSIVQSAEFEGKAIAKDKYGKSFVYRTKKLLKEKRPLYGQVPVLVNVGLQYTGDRLGANVAYNYMGYKTFMTGMTPDLVEYERPRTQLDAQLSYKFLKNKKVNVKLNASNLLNSPFRYYINDVATYKVQDQWRGLGLSEIPSHEWGEIYEWKYGFSQKYEEGYFQTAADGKTKMRIGDRNTLTRKVGSSFSFSIGYSF